MNGEIVNAEKLEASKVHALSQSDEVWCYDYFSHNRFIEGLNHL